MTARKPRVRKAAPRTPTPREAMKKLSISARQALESGIARARTLALATANEARDAAFARAGEARSRTVEAVTKLERVFEQRVSQAIARLGVPSAKDVRALSRRVAELQASVDRLRRARPRVRA